MSNNDNSPVSILNICNNSTTIINRSTEWSLDTYGEDLVACRKGGRIYYWSNTLLDAAPRAAFVSASPTINNYILVSPNDRHLISFGSTEFGTGNYNPMLVRWSDQNNYNDQRVFSYTQAST